MWPACVKILNGYRDNEFLHALIVTSNDILKS